MLLSVGNYSVGPNNESCHRDQQQIVFDGDHLVTTGTDDHIYQTLGERWGGGGGKYLVVFTVTLDDGACAFTNTFIHI